MKTLKDIEKELDDECNKETTNELAKAEVRGYRGGVSNACRRFEDLIRDHINESNEILKDDSLSRERRLFYEGRIVGFGGLIAKRK